MLYCSVNISRPGNHQLLVTMYSNLGIATYKVNAHAHTAIIYARALVYDHMYVYVIFNTNRTRHGTGMYSFSQKYWNTCKHIL